MSIDLPQGDPSADNMLQKILGGGKPPQLIEQVANSIGHFSGDSANSAPAYIAEALRRWGVDPNEVYVADMSNTPYRSGYANLTSSVFDEMHAAFGGGKRKFLGIPGEANKFITSHELSHATTPYGSLTDSLPSALAGNVAAQLGMGIGAVTLGVKAREALRDAIFKDSLTSMISQLPGQPGNIRPEILLNTPAKRKAATIGLAAVLAGYAPRFIEETTANARALKDMWDIGGLSEVIQALPSAAMSQGSYMLPLAGLAAALYQARKAPQKLTALQKAKDLWTTAVKQVSNKNLSQVPIALSAQRANWARAGVV